MAQIVELMILKMGNLLRIKFFLISLLMLNCSNSKTIITKTNKNTNFKTTQCDEQSVEFIDNSIQFNNCGKLTINNFVKAFNSKKQFENIEVSLIVLTCENLNTNYLALNIRRASKISEYILKNISNLERIDVVIIRTKNCLHKDCCNSIKIDLLLKN